MAYRFKLNEGFGKALHRIGLEQHDRALAQLQRAEAGGGVHEARKCIKRLRALLRLVRSGIGAKSFTQLNVALRDAGRAMSDTRDRDVLTKTMAQLAAETPGMRPLLKRLTKDIGTARGATSRQVESRRTARTLLADARTAWAELDLASNDFEPLAAGLERGLRKLAETWETSGEASADDDDDAFHDLRKAVQCHWRQMRLVETGWPEYFGARAEAAKSISDLLGSAQDLTLLLGHLATLDRAGPKRAPLDALEALVRERRDALRGSARVHCSRLVAEGPGSHARRATLFWSTAGTIARGSPAPATGKPSTASAQAPRQAAERASRPPRKRSGKANAAPAKRPAKRSTSRR